MFTHTSSTPTRHSTAMVPALEQNPAMRSLLALSSVQSLVTLAASSADARVIAATEMRRRVLLSLGAKFRHPEQLLNALTTHHTVLSGKYVLSLLDPLGQVTYDTIDFIAGDRHFSLMVHFLEQEQQAKIIDFCPVIRDFDAGAYHYALIFACPNVTVRVIRSSNKNPITTIALYAATHFMNYLTEQHLAVAYPSLTFGRRALQLVENLPARMATNFDVGGRFDIVPNGPDCFHVLCGGRYRRFDDDDSVHMDLVTEDAGAVDGSVRWKLGGPPCEEGCSSDIRVAEG